jgi:hypothetical protein
VERAVGVALDPVALLVDGPMVTATQKGQVVEPGGAAVGPVVEMMPLGVATGK